MEFASGSAIVTKGAADLHLRLSTPSPSPSPSPSSAPFSTTADAPRTRESTTSNSNNADEVSTIHGGHPSPLLALALPTAQSALVAASAGQYHLSRHHALPKLPLPATHLLIRVSHVALNPCNWKMIDFSPALGAVGGNDFSGTVVAAGAETRRRIGDAVCGFLYGLDPGARLDRGEWAGAFAQYVGVDEALVMGVSRGVGLARAACLGAGVVTAGLAVFRSLGLDMPLREDGPGDLEAGEAEPGGGQKSKGFLLIYGGSTATGTMAIQLARLAGYTPITICSPSNFQLVQSFGAEKAFDYHLPSCGISVRSFTKGTLRLVLDCISDSSSMKICYAAMGSRGGKYVALEPPAERLRTLRRDIQTDWVMALTIFGKKVDLKGPFGREASPQDKTWAQEWYSRAEILVAKGLLKPHPACLMPGGLLGVVDGIDQLRKGSISGKKLVYKIEV